VNASWPAKPTTNHKDSRERFIPEPPEPGIQASTLDQPPHPEEVENADKGAVDIAVLGHAGGAVPVVDGMDDHSAIVALDQRWNVPMHMIEVRQAQKRRALNQFQATASVGRGVLEQAAAQAIGETRGPALARGVAAVDPVPRHQLQVATATRVTHQCQHARDVRRVVLPVAIERGQPLPASRLCRVVQRRALAQRAIMMQDA
jgi:hypothetical protein